MLREGGLTMEASDIESVHRLQASAGYWVGLKAGITPAIHPGLKSGRADSHRWGARSMPTRVIVDFDRLATASGLRDTQKRSEGAMEYASVITRSDLTNRRTRSFVAVTGEPQQAELLDVLLADDHDYGLVFVESIARSYSRIKEVKPDIVVVYCAIDDLAACQLLSMLKMDSELCDVLVVTCANAASNAEDVDALSEMMESVPQPILPLQMH